MKYTVYQINLSDEQNDNREIREMYLDTTFRPVADKIVAARSLYEKVCMIEAVDLEHVFEIGNISPEEIDRFKPMHSISVGDVVVDEFGVANFVDSFGFTPVDFFEEENVS